MTQRFFHYKKYSARWNRKCKVVWFKALANVIWLHWNINIQVIFSINPQTFRITLFVVEGQTDRRMGMIGLRVAVRNFGTPLKTWHGYTDGLRQFWNSCSQNIWYHLTICPVTTAIHTIFPQHLISPYCLSGRNSYTHHIPTTYDITLLSVRSQKLYTPYSHNIWYHLTICPFTTAIHTIFPQHLISPYYLSGHNSYTHHIPTISDITLLSVRSQQLYTPHTHNIWYHLTIFPVTTATHTIHRLT
jgi:hypothetical protein